MTNNKINIRTAGNDPNPYTNTIKAKTQADTSDTDKKEIVEFAERFRYILDVKINQLRIAMQRSNTPIKSDMLMIRIQALEWVQGRIRDLILNNVTRNWPVYND
jgi:hypothetical protein